MYFFFNKMNKKVYFGKINEYYRELVSYVNTANHTPTKGQFWEK